VHAWVLRLGGCEPTNFSSHTLFHNVNVLFTRDGEKEAPIKEIGKEWVTFTSGDYFCSGDIHYTCMKQENIT
jgi:hypothetical protein